MKYTILILILFVVSCIDTTNPNVNSFPKPDTSVVSPPSNQNTNAEFMAMGTTNAYNTADMAYAQRNSGRPYYFEYGTATVSMFVYETASTTMPVKGANKWICVTFDNGASWKTLQIDNLGKIVNVQ